MKNNILKIITTGLLVSIILSGVVFQIEAVSNKKTLSLIPSKRMSKDRITLDLKDAIKIEEGIMSRARINTGAKIEAKVKSFKIKNVADKTIESPIKSSTMLIRATSVITDPLETGITWLKNNQNTDGSWGVNNKTEIINTTAVLSLFSAIKEATTTTEYQNATDWLNLTYPENSEYLAKKVTALYEAEQDAGSLPNFLASQINEQDVGFGYQKGYQSDIIITAEVLKAITASAYSDPGTDPIYTLRATLYYLLLSQNSNGGWPKLRNTESDVKTTALVLEALKPYQAYTLGGTPSGDIIIQAKIDFGIYYLKNTQNTNGSWQDVEETAKAYDILLNYQQYPTFNVEALTYLTSAQSVDGSFANQNIYITANALKTIAKPDMTVTDIQQLTDLLPNQATSVLVTIINIGYVSAQPIPSSQFILLVDGQEIPLEGLPSSIDFGANSTLYLNIEITGLPAGEHTIGFRVDYTNIEFRKDNNSHEETFIWTNPVFVGPRPPTWIGATTASSDYPNSIVVNWLPSPDQSEVSAFWLFSGLEPGVYDTIYWIPPDWSGAITPPLVTQTTYYFNVVAVNSEGEDGDWSMETNARAYDIPDNYMGVIPFSPKDNNNTLLYYVNFNLFGIENINSENLNPVPIITYPGHYYVTASKSGYTADAKPVEIKANIITDQVDFTLNIIDDGETPDQIQNLQAQAGDSQITLTWNAFDDSSGDFKNFNIYRSFSEIANVSLLTPINTSTINSATTQFIDTGIINNIDYYYAVTAEDTAGNQNSDVTDAGPLKGNSQPGILNISANQNEATQAQIQYDITDNEQTNAIISIEYWKNSSWYTASAIIGAGLQNIGAKKSILWNPQIDYPGYDGTTTIRITANDRQSVNQFNSLESEEFAIYTPVTLSPPNSPGNDWEMFSVPLQMRDADASVALSDDLGLIFSDWMLAYWQPTEEAFQYHRATCCPWARSTTSIISMVPGLSYWLVTRLGPYDVDVEGTFVPNSDYSIHLDVSPGATSTWNQISTPFNYSVAWASSTIKVKYGTTTVDIDTAQSNGWIDNKIWWWDGVEYRFDVAPEGQLDPWLGYWVRNFIEVDLIISPIQIESETTATSLLKITPQAKKLKKPKDKELPNWKIQLSVVAGDKRDTYNFAGIHPDSKDDYDRWDVAEPPAISSGISLYFPHNDWPFAGGDYAQDIRESTKLRWLNNPKKANSKEWYFEIKNNTSNTSITLKWAGLDQVEYYELSLIDLDVNQIIDIYNIDEYAYQESEEVRHFKLTARPFKARKK